MAIVFISPRANQKIFLKTVGMLFLLVLVIAFLTFLIIFLSRDNATKSPIPVSQKNIDINFDIIDSLKVSNLKPFYALETTFSYIIIDETGNEIKGNIAAGSIEEARVLLEVSGFQIFSIKEAGIGRTQPFMLY